MIALLAAVPEETALLGTALEGGRESASGGVALLRGRLAGREVCLAHGGIGKAAAAAAAVALLHACRPEALWLLGCGGAYPGTGLEIGDLALADAEIFGDEGVRNARGFRDLAAMRLPMRQGDPALFNCWPVDRKLLGQAQHILAGHAREKGISLRSGPFVTVSTCTGTAEAADGMARRTGGICENMEGAAVALACRQMKVPLLELRGISNLVEEYDPARWDLAAGMAAAQHAVLALLRGWPGGA